MTGYIFKITLIMDPVASLNIISTCNVLHHACTTRRDWDEKVKSASTQQSSPIPYVKKPRWKKKKLSDFLPEH